MSRLLCRPIVSTRTHLKSTETFSCIGFRALDPDSFRSCVFISGGIAAGQVARHLLIQPNQAHHASREQLYTPDESIQINASTQNRSINHSIQIRMDSPGRRSACSQGATGFHIGCCCAPRFKRRRRRACHLLTRGSFSSMGSFFFSVRQREEMPQCPLKRFSHLLLHLNSFDTSSP